MTLNEFLSLGETHEISAMEAQKLNKALSRLLLMISQKIGSTWSWTT